MLSAGTTPHTHTALTPTQPCDSQGWCAETELRAFCCLRTAPSSSSPLPLSVAVCEATSLGRTLCRHHGLSGDKRKGMINFTSWLKTSFPWGRSAQNYPCLPGNAHPPLCLRCSKDADTPLYWALTVCQAAQDILHTACLVHPTTQLTPCVETDTGWEPLSATGCLPGASASPCDRSSPSLTHNLSHTHSFCPPHLDGQLFTFPVGYWTQGLGCREAITVYSPHDLWGCV